MQLTEKSPPLPSIAESDAYLRMLVTCVQDYAIYSLDQTGHVNSWNVGAERITGYAASEILGRHFSVFHPDDAGDTADAMWELQQAKAKGRYEVEDWRLRRDGSKFLAQIVITSLLGEQGDLQGYAVVKRDITMRQRMEDRFLRVVEYSPGAIVMINKAGKIEMVNAQTERMFGYSRTEMLGQTVEFLLPLRFRALHPTLRGAFFSSPVPRPMGAGRELYGLRRDGSEFPIEIGLNPIETDDGVMVLSVIVDISERKRLEQRFRQVVQEAPNAMIMVDTAGRIRIFNRQAEVTFGYGEGELLGQAMEVLVPARFRPAHPALRVGFSLRPEARPMGVGRELYGLHKNGSEFPIEIGLNPIETEEGTMVLAAIVDITSRKSAQKQIEAALKEKTVLLNEIHHRVKNNLQVIISLLNMQVNTVSDDAAKSVLIDSQARVRSMAMIHQLLYERHDFSRVDLGEYLQRFGQVLLSSFGSLTRNINLRVDASADLVYIELQRATPCGLLINELVTNAFKHAYPDGVGEVRIILNLTSDGGATLIVADHGVGLPVTHLLENTKSLGLQLIPVLVEQIGGSLNILDNNPGTRFEVSFPVV